VERYWRAINAPREGEAARSRCLVTGALGIPVAKHPKVERLPGAGGAEKALVSCDNAAGESYGWRKNQNAPISRGASIAFSTALNRLLDPAWRDPNQPGVALPRRSTSLSSDTVVCYWAADRTGDVFLDDLDALFQSDPAKVEQLYQSVWRGRPVSDLDSIAFFALTLTGTQGRAIVRDSFESTVAKVQRNLAQHFADLRILRNTPSPKDRELQLYPALRTLIGSLAPLGRDRKPDAKRLPAGLAAQLLRAALAGTPYPLGILVRAVDRTRAEMSRKEWADLERRDARASLIKAVLNRRRRVLSDAQSRYKEVTSAMDPTNSNPGYLLGRLMAVIERLQQLAQPEIKTTVVDRYFAGGSAAPRAVFVRLLKGARHHAKKSKDEPKTRGTAQWLESQLDCIAFRFNPKQDGFPTSLSLEDQGLFVLGYHHQRHVLWMSKEQRSSWLASVAAAGQEVEPAELPHAN
jgi:CRISPR-associated protein Csd1